ncbi:MAG: hypothetical protein ACJA0H_002075 [Francisellaceae bacterium]|jgi:hypothetical protein
MKKFITLCLVLATSTYAQAEIHARPKPGYENTNLDGISKVNNSVYLSGQMTGFGYTEYDGNDNWFNQQTGFLWGARTGVTYTIDNIYLNAEIYSVGGDTQYKGGITDGFRTEPFSSHGENSFTVGSVKAGYTFYLQDEIALTPYFEFGARYWDRKIDGGSSATFNAGSVQETYQTMFADIGLLFQYEIIKGLVINLLGSVGSTINPTMKIESGFGAGVDGTEFDQGTSAIYEIDLSANYFITESFSILGGLEFTYFEFGKSNTVNGFLEPKSTTKQGNLYVGLAYSF